MNRKNNLTCRVKQKLIYLLVATSSFAQNLEEFEPPTHIKTVMFQTSPDNNGLAVVALDEQITLRFDDINADDSAYYYTIERKNAMWEKSNLFRAEYMDGYDDIRIQNIAYSVGTLQPYMHYTLTLPNAQTRITKSGNYVLKIWDEEQRLVIQRRFVVLDSNVNLGVRIQRAQNMEVIETHQSVQFSLSTEGLNLRLPEQELRIFVVQNQQWQTWTNAGTPTYTMGNKLEFTHKPETLFPGGNEYLFFDTQELRSGGGNVAYVLRDELYQSILNPQWVRSGRPYTFAPDTNGAFRINTFQGTNPFTEADYTDVHFSLFAEDFLLDAEHYVVGDFNQHIKSDENKLKLNPETGRLEAKILIKQGIYNYKFTSRDLERTAYDHLISGSYWPTENDYYVLVYYRKLGARCDELIAVGSASSADIGL